MAFPQVATPPNVFVLDADERELMEQFRLAKSWGHAKILVNVRNSAMAGMEVTKLIKKI